MSRESFWGWRVSYWALRSRKANRLSLAVLGDFFAQAAEPATIVRRFGLKSSDLDFLAVLADREDGWYPLSSLPTLEAGQAFGRLVKNGFLLARPWPRLIRLSDAGRFLLILGLK
ncbi:MAG: hypothetical protein LBR11_11665 [Deltaproteobacteria bacterium]|jgi:hypothetical protein|nr:hypothetical protein [Deltaproteobacteria bacterium]